MHSVRNMDSCLQRLKCEVYFGRPRPRTVRITSFSSSGGLADSHAPRPCAGNFLRPRGQCAYNSACARWMYTERKLKPVLYFPHVQSGRVHGQRGRGLLVIRLPKACAGGPLRGRNPYMHSRSAWTVNKHVNKQLPRVIAHLAVFLLFYRRIVEVRVATSVFTQPTDARSEKMGGTRMSAQTVRAHPPMTIFTSRIP